MQIIANDKFVRSRVKIGNIANFASMGLLAVGFVISLQQQTLGSIAVFLAYVAMIGAFLLLSYGRTFSRRWGPRFRQDQWLIPALRGTDNKYTMFNFASKELPDHLLVGPGGLFVLVPRSNGGTILFENGKWSRGSAGSTILRGISEGGLGNPFIDVRIALTKLAEYLKKHGSQDLIDGLEARPVLVFTNPGVQLRVRNAPISVVHAKDLRSIIRRAKPILAPEKVEELKKVLSREVEP